MGIKWRLQQLGNLFYHKETKDTEGHIEYASQAPKARAEAQASETLCGPLCPLFLCGKKNYFILAIQTAKLSFHFGIEIPNASRIF